MNRLPALHTVLAGLVASAAMACNCPDPIEETIVIDPQAPSLQQARERCEFDAADCEALCSKVYDLVNGPGSAEYQTFTECELVDYDGRTAVRYVSSVACVGGRRPPGAELDDHKEARSASGAWFASLAELEEASVYAFVWLGLELKRLGAPAELIARCTSAAADEIAHAHAVRRLAMRFGAEPAQATKPNLPAQRSLREVALENAQEGCVRETFGALVAVWQSKHSRDPLVRSTMRTIAIDESRHAELSSDIDRWARSKLSAADRALLDHAKFEAVETLRSTVMEEVCDELITQAGLPRADAAQTLFAQAERTLWAQ